MTKSLFNSNKEIERKKHLNWQLVLAWNGWVNLAFPKQKKKEIEKNR